MIVEIAKTACLHLKEMSRYDHNYHQLPFQVNGCTVIYQEYQEAFNSSETSIGVMEEGKYAPKFWLHTDERLESENFIFDSETMKEQYEWT